jgi:lysophospholipase L1-like esterase
MVLNQRAILGAAALLCAGLAAAEPAFELHDGDRVAFYGDSITAQRFYTRDVEDYVATRYPRLQVRFHNAGVPGDSVHGGYTGDVVTRVDRDLKPWAPTVVTVMLGMNDGGYVPPDAKILAAYEAGYAKLLGLLRAAAPQARMTLLENTPYDEITHGTEFTGYMATTVQNARASAALAAREQLPVVDTSTPVTAFLKRARAADLSFASLLVPDRIHPAEPLHWLVAAELMRAWHLDPVVSAVAIDARQRRVTQAERTAVSDLAGDGRKLEWKQQDEALPLPFDFENAFMNFVLRHSDLFAQDQETLRVQGLQAGRYALQIDGMAVGEFTARQLAQGLNLATMKTPMWRQAREFDAKLGERSLLESADLTLGYSTQVAERAQAAQILREGQAEIEQKNRQTVQPVMHHYVLAAVAANRGKR